MVMNCSFKLEWTEDEKKKTKERKIGASAHSLASRSQRTREYLETMAFRFEINCSFSHFARKLFTYRRAIRYLMNEVA